VAPFGIGDSVPGWHHASGFDHEDRGPLWCSCLVQDTFGHGVSLVPSEYDRLAIFEIYQQLAVENQEELVLVIVLVPVKLTLEDAETHDGIVDGGKSLVEPRLVSGDLGR
jgi:hypothetical protein